MRDKDRYNREVCPRTLPLREGTCILREPLLSDPYGAAELNWYVPASGASTNNRRVHLPGPQTGWQDVQNQPVSGLSALQIPRLHSGVRERGYGGLNIHLQSHGDPVPDAASHKLLQATPVPNRVRGD